MLYYSRLIYTTREGDIFSGYCYRIIYCNLLRTIIFWAYFAKAEQIGVGRKLREIFGKYDRAYQLADALANHRARRSWSATSACPHSWFRHVFDFPPTGGGKHETSSFSCQPKLSAVHASSIAVQFTGSCRSARVIPFFPRKYLSSTFFCLNDHFNTALGKTLLLQFMRRMGLLIFFRNPDCSGSCLRLSMKS